MLQRPLGLLRNVDLALLEALDQIVGREIDQFDRVGAVEHRIRHGFAHPDAGDLGDDIVEALDVLDIDGGIDVDAVAENFFDVEIALGVPAAGRIGVGKFIDQHDLRMTCDDGVEVHLREGLAFVGDLPGAERFRDLRASCRSRGARGSRPRRRPHRRLRGAWHGRAAALHRFCRRLGPRRRRF